MSGMIEGGLPDERATPKICQVMGPGLITGASDDDPSGIATYSQVGAQFGYGLAWTLVISYPLMAAIQEISARIRLDTYVGMALSNLVALFIVITTAATLHAHGVLDIQTSDQAAEALRAIAGPLTFAIFATGIIGTGLLALPVLAGSAAYALGEVSFWHVGLARKPWRAKAFYATIAAGMLVGIGFNFTSIDPVKALYWSAVINGIVAVPVMVIMMLLAMRPAIMGSFVLPRPLQVMGWLATAAMAATVAGLVWSWVM